jgi:hypothetical protein
MVGKVMEAGTANAASLLLAVPVPSTRECRRKLSGAIQQE